MQIDGCGGAVKRVGLDKSIVCQGFEMVKEKLRCFEKSHREKRVLTKLKKYAILFLEGQMGSREIAKKEGKMSYLKEIEKIVSKKEEQIKKDTTIFSAVVSILKFYQKTNKCTTNEDITIALYSIFCDIFDDDYLDTVIECSKRNEVLKEKEITKEILAKINFLATLCILRIAYKKRDKEEFRKKMMMIKKIAEKEYDFVKEYLDKIRDISRR